VSASEPAAALEDLASALRGNAWELAIATAEEGLVDDQVPSLQRLGRLGQLGEMPSLIGALAREVEEPSGERLRLGSALAAQARDHAREREALGFAPREVVTEFLLLRRVLSRFVSERAPELAKEQVLLVEGRLNDTVDRLVTECVVAYFDRATLELAHQARHDQLTGLLHHQAFVDELELELERAARYQHGVALVFVDLDRFKQINDTLGHPAGDRAIRAFTRALRDSLRRSDLAGRMGGDEFAACLVEANKKAAPQVLARLNESVGRLTELGDLPGPFTFSAGCAHFPDEGRDVDTLVSVADERLYTSKRANAA